MITISTNDLIEYREVRIDGKVYKIRRLGAGEQLDIMRLSRDLARAADKLKGASGDDGDNIAALDDGLGKIASGQEKILAVYGRAIQAVDGGNVKNLLRLIGIDGVQRIFAEVFDGE